MNDEQIVSGCIAGKAMYQRLLYDKYQAKMLGVCIRYVTSKEEAQDILQDGFIQVFRKITTFQGTGSLEGWIRKIMVNTALQYLRKNKSMNYQQSIEGLEEKIEAQSDALAELAVSDILKLIQELPEGYRTIFNLYAIEGYSHKEIAEKLNISVNTSFSQFSRAKGLLKKYLAANKVV